MEKLFKKLKRSSDEPLLGFGTSPQADWKVIFFSALFLLVTVSLMNGVIFIRIKNGEIFSSTSSQSAELQTLNVAKLKSTIEYYQGKEDQFLNIKSASSTQVVDPSL